MTQARVVFASLYGAGSFATTPLVAIALAPIGLATLTVTHVITVYNGRLTLRAGRHARERSKRCIRGCNT